MDSIRRVWIILSDDAAPYCNEREVLFDRMARQMPTGVLEEVAGHISRLGWECTALCGKAGLAEEHREACRRMKAEIVVPAGCRAPPPELPETVVVFRPDQVHLRDQHDPENCRAVLRIARQNIGLTAESAGLLAERFHDVSIRHPELADYDERDLDTYEDQIGHIGEWLQGKGMAWRKYRIDCLTDAMQLDQPQECGAGNTAVAVAPDGTFFPCPGFAKDAAFACGSVSEGLRIPNRRLFTRQYALPCLDACSAWHCARCVYLHKRATREVCVPSAGACRLAHREMKCQHAWVEKLKAQGLLSVGLRVVEAPVIDDPVQLVQGATSLFDATATDDTWRHLVRFTGRPKDMSGFQTLSIIHELCGTAKTLLECLNAGLVPDVEPLLRDPLVRARRMTIDRYKDVRLSPDIPTVAEVEALLFQVAALVVSGVRDGPQATTGGNCVLASPEGTAAGA